MRILICDDHPVFAESFAAVLGSAGYEVPAVTHSPDEALAALARHQVDVAVLDVRFPDGDILSRLPELRAAAPATRTVLLTAESDPNLVRHALAAGTQGVAHKGAQVADICATLDRVYAGEIVTGHDAAPTPGRSRPTGPSREAQRLARDLTRREREVLCHLVRGKDTKALARATGVTWSTARGYVQSVLTKLRAHSRLEAAAVAVRYGLVSGETGEWLL
ncbi:MAG TPA: response regulator transcription factor [Micromonosporaceae bacterium]